MGKEKEKEMGDRDRQVGMKLFKPTTFMFILLLSKSQENCQVTKVFIEGIPRIVLI